MSRIGALLSHMTLFLCLRSWTLGITGVGTQGIKHHMARDQPDLDSSMNVSPKRAKWTCWDTVMSAENSVLGASTADPVRSVPVTAPVSMHPYN